jgi:peptidoglycan-associated lipoprotein
VAAAPAPAPAAPSEYASHSALKAIFFDFDRSAVRTPEAVTLDATAAWLKANPNNLLLIEGHTDERGTNEYNLALSERRAKAATTYLVSRGIDAGRISIISYGEERPDCAGHLESCWSKNRRDQFLTKSK